MVVVSDTSPVSGLYRIGHLHLLRLLYQKVIIPDAVFQELLRLRSFGFDLEEILAAHWIEVKTPGHTTDLITLRKELDAGEAEAIVLAKEFHADLLLMDEAKGRTIAKREGLPIIGLIGVLAEAKMEGHILLLKPLLDQLIHTAHFRVSPALYRIILAKVGE